MELFKCFKEKFLRKVLKNFFSKKNFQRNFFFLFGVLFVFVVSCTGTSSLSPVADRLVVGVEKEPRTLNPLFATDAYSTRMVEIIYSSLVKQDESGLFKGDLALSWEQPDNKKYIFHLRDNAFFHDGTPLTCDDIKNTFAIIMDSQSKSPYHGDFELVDFVACSDKRTLIVNLKEPFAPFLTSMTVGVIPKHIKNSDELGQHPIGSGPFRFVAQRAGDFVLLERFDKYYGEVPKVKEVVFRVIPNSITRVLELEKGTVDLLINSVPPESLDRLRKNEKIKIIRTRGINYNYIGFNLKDAILSKHEVRRAIAYAVDREALIKYVWRGAAQLATGLLSSRNWAYNPNVKVYDYNPSLAKKILDEAGYPDPDADGPLMRFHLSFKTTTDRLRRRIAEVIRTQLESVGIGVEVRSYEFGTFYNDIKNGNFQLYTLTWVGITEPDIYHFVFHSSSAPPKGANRNSYSNSEVDKLTDEGRREINPLKRKVIYAQVQEIIAEDLPYVSLYYTDDIAVIRERVQGFKLTLGGGLLGLLSVSLLY